MGASPAIVAAAEAAVDAVAGAVEAPVWALSDEQVAESLVLLQRARCGVEAIEAEQVRVIAEAVDQLPHWFGDEERHDAAVELIGYAQMFDTR